MDGILTVSYTKHIFSVKELEWLLMLIFYLKCSTSILIYECSYLGKIK